MWSGLPSAIEDRIIPEPNSGCWIWLGALRDSKDSYGGLSYKGRPDRAHRFVFEFLRHAVPKNLVLDHLCRNKLCCNPEHLEPVTPKTNIHRGEGVAARNRLKTHCPQGHEYSVENTTVYKNQRYCRTCSDKHKRDYYERQVVKRVLWDEHL